MIGNRKAADMPPIPLMLSQKPCMPHALFCMERILPKPKRAQQPHQQDPQPLCRHNIPGNIAFLPEQPPDMPGQMIQPFRGGGGLPYRFRFRVRAFRLFFAQQQGIGGNTQCRRQHDDAFGIGGGFASFP